MTKSIRFRSDVIESREGKVTNKKVEWSLNMQNAHATNANIAHVNLPFIKRRSANYTPESIHWFYSCIVQFINSFSFPEKKQTAKRSSLSPWPIITPSPCSSLCMQFMCRYERYGKWNGGNERSFQFPILIATYSRKHVLLPVDCWFVL